jgi:antagonist of KipI
MRAGRAIPQVQQPAYAADPVIGVIPGPHLDRFAQGSWETFLAGAYQVSTQSNRMGYRLTGPSLAHHSSADLVSQAVVLGAVQVPGDGQPMVMMADHPTTGGYTIIATVARTDLPLLAQVEPGRGTLRFKAVDLHAAQQAWVGVVKMLDQIEFEQEDLWTGF